MEPALYKSKNNIRVVTATSLFDGHDASINIMRRMLQDTGVEVIHLGHNRSVQEIVDAAIDEDVQGIAISSYQGGHIEFFKYIVDLLKERGTPHVKIFGGGGGVIVPEEIRELESYGVEKLYSPDDGSVMGLQGIINHMVESMDFSTINGTNFDFSKLVPENRPLIANMITALVQAKNKKNGQVGKILSRLSKTDTTNVPVVIGLTGTGGAGKSSLTDELILRFLNDFSDIRIALICSDPTRHRTGGALLGDRIRMNAINTPRVYMRSLATRESHTEIANALPETIEVLKTAGYDLILAETAGIGQGDINITDIVDFSIYVMTSEFGAATQLEKIEMLDYANIIAVNKFEKHGGEDAIRDVRKQVQRNTGEWDKPLEDMPVFGTIASRFNDDGVTAMYHAVLDLYNEKTDARLKSKLLRTKQKTSTLKKIIIPSRRVRYLSEIADTIREYHEHTMVQADKLRNVWHLQETAESFSDDTAGLLQKLKDEIVKAEKKLDNETKELIKEWDDTSLNYSKNELIYKVREKEFKLPLYEESLSHLKIPKVVLPAYKDPGETYTWLRKENLPGYFPFTAGTFPVKRADEDPTRMFAGEGDPFRTNNRFKLLSANFEAKRLSTAFDSVTLYGFDPDERMDIYGKIGNSGVSICTLDDVKVLYGGFDLCSPNNSVSMTINGPAPIILAMFFNTAVDQQVENYKKENGKEPDKIEYENIRSMVLNKVRGTVQADILKEDQGQNTCIFSIEFALKMMGDIQEYFIENNIKNFYSVSISGYHIAEAGANPLSQLAFTLSNGFTYLEYYLSRGMPLDSFAPNMSFFFSNGMDPEYTVIGRVARRIWAIALKHKYNASVRSQMLKYHIQTSGRSLHCQDIQFNDIRTTLQALCAVYDNCNSLHTNSYDEAITTPSRESVRRALAIQQIINQEWGITKNQNMYQGSFIVEELTSLVEEAVLSEFDRITERGGVLGAMETGYQRGKIQDESMYYELLKHTGKIPIIGVNTFVDEEADAEQISSNVELARATDDEKESQLKRLADFHKRNEDKSEEALARLKEIALSGGNLFSELMDTVRVCSLGQITNALYGAGGQYRRNM